MRKYTRHHVIPFSRYPKNCKKEKQEVLLPKKFHDAYHTIFANLAPIEAIDFMYWLQKKMWNSKKVTYTEIVEKQEEMKNEGISAHLQSRSLLLQNERAGVR